MDNTSVNDNLSTLVTWADALLAKLNPAQRLQLLRQIAQDLRRNQAQRIVNQQAPDGTTYTPRKHRKNLKGKQGRIKRQKVVMFNKLRTNKHLRMEQATNQLAVGFYGRVARIAQIHQEGLKDKVTENGVGYPYPKRQLLGFNLNDHTLILELLLLHLSSDIRKNT